MGVGADLAREAGGVVLLGNDLLHLPWTLALAFFGYLHPLLAAFIVLGSSRVVIHNSFRLAVYRPQMEQQRRVESAVDR